jgi:thiamine biosynthesis lipoprotein
MSMPSSGRRARTLVFLLVIGLFLAACGGKDPVAQGRATAFGAPVDITLIGVNRTDAREITQTLADEFALMDAAWEADEGGPLARVNTLINAGSEPFAAPPSLLSLLALAKQLSQQSDDLFNPAIGHLTRAWGFADASPECRRPPDDDLIAQVLAARPTMQDIHIDGFRLWSDNQTARLDLRDIRRGYAIDRAISRLQELGIRSARVSIDGNMRAIGSRDGHPWSHTIRGPDGGGVYATLNIKGNEAAFTAGTYQNAFTWEGEVFHDIIDPRTGYPAAGTASVTVLHPNASTADAAATALFVAGPSAWHRLARQLGVRYVMLTDTEGRVHMNPAMQQRIKLQNTDREIIISEPLS